MSVTADMRTGIFATVEENMVISALVQAARRTPVIALGRSEAAWLEWQRVKQRIHAMALAHGLPEVPGFYGYDGAAREFLKPQ